MKIVAFDCESNGLHGQAFAVGGVVWDTQARRVSNPIALRCPIRGKTDPWVAENVLPALRETPRTHLNARAMRDAFWQWLQANKQDAIVLVDVGYPVEARFLAQCQNDDPARAWEAPYPLHELASILLASGINPDIDRAEQFGQALIKHHPRDDALAAAVIAGRALEKADMARLALAQRA